MNTHEESVQSVTHSVLWLSNCVSHISHYYKHFIVKYIFMVDHIQNSKYIVVVFRSVIIHGCADVQMLIKIGHSGKAVNSCL